MSKVDVEIEHVTKAGSNLFEELGFSSEEALLYKQESLKEIHQLLAMKEQLMEEIAGWVRSQNLKQEDAARILHVTRPRISDVLNKKGSKFTIDALVNMLARAGKPVRIVVG